MTSAPRPPHATVTDETCLGCCPCPTCGGMAHWSRVAHLHACVRCLRTFRDHTGTEGEQTALIAEAGQELARLGEYYERRYRKPEHD